MMNDRKKNIGKYILLIIVAIVILFPMVYMISNSFMSSEEISEYYNLAQDSFTEDKIAFHIIPDLATLNQYYNVFIRNPEFLNKFWKSIMIVVPIIIGQVAILIPASFVFAKLKFPYKKQIFFILIIMMLMPSQVTLVPNYIVLKKLNMIGNYTSLIIPGMFSALGVVLLTQFMRNIPNEIIEAAKIDGAGYFKIFAKIIVPEAKGGIVAMLILSFADAWNMIEKPIVFLRDKNLYPLSTYLSNINESSTGLAFACGIIYMIPAILVFLWGEKYLLDGMKNLEMK